MNKKTWFIYSLIPILFIQVLVILLILANEYGINTFILRPAIGFIYLSLIPGALIFRMLKIHNLNNVETICFVIGISIVFNMFLGFIINYIYPLLGIEEPLSIASLTITWTILLFILSIVAFRINDAFIFSFHSSLKSYVSTPALLIYFIPCVSIMGSLLLNSHNIAALPVQLALLALIAVIVILFITSKAIPEELYPLLIVSIAISLLLHYSLATYEIPGRDARSEYFLMSSALINGLWDPSIPEVYNAMLSVTILPSIYTQLMGIESKWVFIAVWPILFTVAPLCLYSAYKRQIGNKNAVIAVFYLLIISTFYANITTLPRQEIGLIMLSLIVLVMVNNDLNQTMKTTLMIIWIMGIITTHYSISYLLILFFIGFIFIRFLFRIKNRTIVSINFFVLFVTLSISWYLYNAQSSLLESMINVGTHISSSLITGFINLQSREVTYILTTGIPGSIRYAHVFLLLLMQLFIGIGILKLIFERRFKVLQNDYSLLSVISLLFLICCILVPLLSDSMGLERLYIIVLFFLAPYVMSGGELGLTIFFGIIKRGIGNIHNLISKCPFSKQPSHCPPMHDMSSTNCCQLHNHNICFIISSIAVIGLFLFASGFVYSVSGQSYSSPALNTEHSYKAAWFTYPEEAAGYWLLDRMQQSNEVWVDDSGRNFFLAYRESDFTNQFTVDKVALESDKQIPLGAYIYLRKYNLEHGTVLCVISTTESVAWKRYIKEVKINNIFDQDRTNKIYINSYSVIYKMHAEPMIIKSE